MLSPELQHLFDQPPRDFSPTPLWWWSGAKVTRDRLEWQMRRFQEGGVHNLVVINLAPAGPSFGAPADDPAWFSEEWWARFTDACEIAADLGMRLWCYDQIGFSGANVQGAVTHRHPEAMGRSLRARRTVVSDGTVALNDTEDLVGAYAVDGSRLPSTGKGAVTAPDGTEILLVTAVPTAFDYLEARAVDLLLDRIHREYDRRVPQYLGNVIAGSFQDELPGTNSWTGAFPQEFLRRRGYDLLDHLPALFAAGQDLVADAAHAAGVRADYYAVRAALTEEALFRPLAAWHDERGMLLGADQSNPARAGYPAQSTQIYTDYFRTHRWYSAAGSDHEGDAKVHSSMAHLYGHDRVWIEAFHSSGWGGTLEDTYDWLLPFLRSGANLYNPHASYFGTAGGWFEWAPPSTDWRQPYWRQYPAFARAVARIGSLMTWGGYSADVAVLHPTATMQSAIPLDVPVRHFGDGTLGAGYEEVDRTQRDYLDLCGTNNWFHTRLGALDRACVAFDVIDDDSVQRAEPRDGALRLGDRDLAYRVVLLPSARVLEEGTARRLAQLLDAGGRVVVVGRHPAAAAGVAGDDEAVARLLAHPRLERAADPGAAAAALADAVGHATADVPLLVRRTGVHAVALVTGAFPNASGHPLRKEANWLWDDYDFDPARYARTTEVTVRAEVAEAEVWNPATGERRPVPVAFAGGASTLTVPLGGAPAALVVWREGAADATATRDATVATDVTATTDAAGAAGVVVDLSDGWHGRLAPTLDNTWGDLALPAAAPVDDLQIWHMEWTETGTETESGSGTDGPEHEADWERAKVTYGNLVRVLSPAPADRAPEPLDPAAVAEVLAGARPLVPRDEGWTGSAHSASRGVLDPGHGALGNKGLVAEEFVRVPVPPEGSVARVRTIVDTDHRGAADLVVGAAATKRVWWNGCEVRPGSSPQTGARGTAQTGARGTAQTSAPRARDHATPGAPPAPARPYGYLARARVRVDQARNVLEYELADSRMVRGIAAVDAEALLGSSFCLTAPGGWPDRPEFMRLPDGIVPQGQVTYRARIAVDDTAQAVLVVGAATGVTVRVDDAVVARQEKVQYYEADWGAVPMYFRHRLELAPGEHTVELTADSTHPRDAVFADLVARTPAGATALVSGAGWEVHSGDWRGHTVEHDGRWSELHHCHAAVRPHPLPDTAWLNGAPDLGAPALPLRTTDRVAARTQHFRFTVPAGTVSLTLPLERGGTVRVGGAAPEPVGGLRDVAGGSGGSGGDLAEGDVPDVSDGHVLDLAEPLQEPTEVLVTTAPTAVLRGGSAWAGPVRVRTRRAPMPLGDWRGLGLAGWSGAVVYSRALTVPEGPDPVLDLGRVRGSVEVSVDGRPVGEAFCAPYRFALHGAAGRTVHLEVTVHGTLAPFLHETTPTAWTFPSQLSSGLTGPVTLETAPGPAA
ncbi:glycosyl hydrolase [Streptomyces odontomachi]|uniref:glycosyl hydrolase n=1 Tax=Streptomyces odontomachi TaxID=2944940 RepID=UPI00210DE677|nr:glycosyl hydrolase [Streptomyces sp. ODS25]